MRIERKNQIISIEGYKINTCSVTRYFENSSMTRIYIIHKHNAKLINDIGLERFNEMLDNEFTCDYSREGIDYYHARVYVREKYTMVFIDSGLDI